MSSKPEEIEYKGKKILYYHLENCTPGESIDALNEIESIAKNKPENSILNITNAENSHYDASSLKRVIDFTTNTSWNLKKSAIIGVKGLTGFALKAVCKASIKPIKAFDNIDEAKEWLVKD